MSVLRVYTRTRTKAPFLSFAFLPKAPTHLTRDTRTSRILARSICTAPGQFSEGNSVDRPTAGYLVTTVEKKSKREESAPRARICALAGRAELWVTSADIWTSYGQFPEISPLGTLSVKREIDFSSKPNDEAGPSAHTYARRTVVRFLRRSMNRARIVRRIITDYIHVDPLKCTRWKRTFDIASFDV